MKCKKINPPLKDPEIVVEKLTPYFERIELTSAVYVAEHDQLAPCKSHIG